jgi:hypothetical protein
MAPSSVSEASKIERAIERAGSSLQDESRAGVVARRVTEAVVEKLARSTR